MASRVLIITDSPALHGELTHLLEPEGAQLLSATNGADAFATAVSQRPELILLDGEVDAGGGLLLCARLQADVATASIPLLFLCPEGDAASRAQAFDLGATDSARTPIEPAELRARVRSALRTRRYQELLEARAQIDALTGLRNRSFFDARVRDAAAACQHRAIPFCLVMIDIDTFESLQEDHGHPFADHVLQTVAAEANACLRASDALCRFAGHQLALVHIGKGQSSAMETARRVQERLLSIRFQPPRHGILVTASLGVAGSDLWDLAGEVTAAAVQAAAEEALASARRGGRGRISEARARFSGAMVWRA